VGGSWLQRETWEVIHLNEESLQLTTSLCGVIEKFISHYYSNVGHDVPKGRVKDKAVDGLAKASGPAECGDNEKTPNQGRN
jgi:hypothetical protein